MKSTTWLFLGLLVGGMSLGARAFWVTGGSKGIAPGAATTTRSPKPRGKLGMRVEDAQSPEFQSWLGEMKQAQLREDEVLDLFDSNLSSAQKNALLDAHLLELSKSGRFPAPERWNARLSEAVLRSEFDLDLGHKAGRILGHVSSPQKLAELEAEYRRRGPTLSAGNKLAIVAASRNPEFVRTVVDDATEPLEVREAAVERVAEVGDPRQLEKIAAPDSHAEPTLKVASVGALAEKAQNTEELSKAVDLAKGEAQPDAFGRTALNVAQARASESGVDGKSTILFQEWKTGLLQLSAQDAAAEALLLQTLVTGKAFSRALWTEANPETAAQLIDGALVPAIATWLGAPGNTPKDAILQALAEFATDYAQECSLRAPAACNSPEDRRSSYRAELAALIRPRVAGTPLAFYAPRL